MQNINTSLTKWKQNPIDKTLTNGCWGRFINYCTHVHDYFKLCVEARLGKYKQPVQKDHLSIKTTFIVSLVRSFCTGLTVFLHQCNHSVTVKCDFLTRFFCYFVVVRNRSLGKFCPFNTSINTWIYATCVMMCTKYRTLLRVLKYGKNNEWITVCQINGHEGELNYSKSWILFHINWNPLYLWML